MAISAAAAKITGSGGAVVGFCPEGDLQSARLEELCRKEGFVMVRMDVGPAVQQLDLCQVVGLE